MSGTPKTRKNEQTNKGRKKKKEKKTKKVKKKAWWGRSSLFCHLVDVFSYCNYRQKNKLKWRTLVGCMILSQNNILSKFVGF